MVFFSALHYPSPAHDKLHFSVSQRLSSSSPQLSLRADSYQGELNSGSVSCGYARPHFLKVILFQMIGPSSRWSLASALRITQWQNGILVHCWLIPGRNPCLTKSWSWLWGSVSTVGLSCGYIFPSVFNRVAQLTFWRNYLFPSTYWEPCGHRWSYVQLDFVSICFSSFSSHFSSIW